jgi:hypothetical protein
MPPGEMFVQEPVRSPWPGRLGVSVPFDWGLMCSRSRFRDVQVCAGLRRALCPAQLHRPCMKLRCPRAGLRAAEGRGECVSGLCAGACRAARFKTCTISPFTSNMTRHNQFSTSSNLGFRSDQSHLLRCEDDIRHPVTLSCSRRSAAYRCKPTPPAGCARARFPEEQHAYLPSVSQPRL